MLRVIASSDLRMRDAFIALLGLEKKEDTSFATVYQKSGYIFLALKNPLKSSDGEIIAETFLPERLYLPFATESIDVVHEIGDIIVPNVFIPYDQHLEETMITRDNRDTFGKNARFLEIFDEQKDYYVEDFWLSIGGIVVSGVPEKRNEDTNGKLMLAYEADVYSSDDLSWALDIASLDTISTLILAGVVRGKEHPKHRGENPYTLVARDMLTTMRLMEEEE